MTNIIVRNKAWQWLLIITLLGVFTLPAEAAIPDNVDYQGYLTDSGGSPINGTVSVTFSLYNMDSGGISLWTDTQSVTLTNGLFNIKLGRVGNPFPLGLFDAPLWLGIDVASDGEMAPRIAFSSAGFAHKADDADTVGGISASSLDQSAHVTDTGNPHSVTAAQTGAVTSANFTLHTGDASAHHAKYTDAEAVTAMGVLDNTNPLHHDRRTGGQVFGAVLSRDGAGSALDADLLDGADSSAFANALHNHTGSLYGKVAVVAQSGGDYVSPLDAMTNLATWCGVPSASNPCLVRILPGVYDLGNNALTMQPYVDVEGSGENTTTITSTHSSSIPNTSATVSVADNAEIRFLTVVNQGVSTYVIAVYVDNSTSPKLTHVTATASGGSYSAGVYNNLNSTPNLTHVTATASGATRNYGVLNSSSTSTLTHVTASASGGLYSYGVYNSGYFPVLTNVTATASGGSFNYGVYNSTSSPTLKEVSSNGIVITGNTLFVPASGTDTENGALLLSVANEIVGLGAPSATNGYVIKLDAGTYDLGNNGFAMQSYVDVEGSGENTTTITSTHSAFSEDENSATVAGADNAEIRFLTIVNQGGSYIALAIYNYAASPKITHVTTTASGATFTNSGVYNNSSSPTMSHVTVVASGGEFTLGVFNYMSSSPIMRHVTAIASEGIFNRGVTNSDSSSPTMTDVTATALGGARSSGVHNQVSSSPTMINVTAKASGGTLENYGIYNSGSSPTIKGSSASGNPNSIYNSGSTARVVSTMLESSVTGGGFTCVGAYDENFLALGAGCL